MLRTIIAFFRLLFYFLPLQGTKRKLFRLQDEGNYAERDRIVAPMIKDWARFVVRLTGKKTAVAVTGQEMLPQGKAVLFVANHQSYLDIPVLLGFVDKPMAFIGKSELLKVPFISGWMQLIECVFLDQKNPRQAMKDMSLATEKIKRGYSLLIFPEGHRSKSDGHRKFHPGSLRLAFKTGAPIVPITINGTYKLLEGPGRMSSADVFITIHPPVQTEGLSREEQREVVASVEQAVLSALPASSPLIEDSANS